MRDWLLDKHYNFEMVNPFEIAIAVMFFFSGLGLVFFAPDPMSVIATFPQLLRVIWALILTFGGAFKIVGIAYNHIPLRRAGLALLGGALAFYLTALFTSFTGNAFFILCVVTGLIWACYKMYRRLG